MLRGFRELPRSIHILCLGILINRTGTFIVPFLTLYLTSALGLSSRFATLTLGVYGAGAILAAFVGGHLADRIGRKAVMLTSMVGAAALLLVLSGLRSESSIVAAVFAFAFLGEMYRPATAAMLADLVTPAQRPAAFALSYMAVNLGMAISPILGGLLAEHSYRLLFYGDALSNLAYAALLFATIPETVHLARATHATPADAGARVPVASAALRILRDGTFLVFCAATFLLSVVYMQSHTTLPLHFKQLGIGPAGYGRIIAVNAFLIVCLQIPFTHWLGRFRREPLMVVSALVLGLGFGLTALATTPWPLVGTVAIWTIGEMMQSPYTPSIVADLAPPELRGTYMGVFGVSFSSALMFGAPLGGEVLSRFGGGPLWAGCFVLGLLGALLYASISPAIRRAGQTHP